ncbi:MAG TPA: hypothetical protein VGS22_16385 [Thermoanaerobaculia bacterium]|jgi:hypothetical protein|nr:hypothetical protein [Thermoanaerobaculia bacterium]
MPAAPTPDQLLAGAVALLLALLAVVALYAYCPRRPRPQKRRDA